MVWISQFRGILILVVAASVSEGDVPASGRSAGNAALSDVTPPGSSSAASDSGDGVGGPESRLPMTTASRAQGFAPLAVHFSAVGSASGVIQPQDGDFDRLSYTWDFGDANAGTWAVDGRSRNHATGFVAGHVFEQPGTAGGGMES